MPGYVPALGALATKLVTLFPHNAAPVPTHQALIARVRSRDGLADRADGRHGDHRDADGRVLGAVGAAAGPRGRPVLAVLGTGVQARAHARALPRVRPIREIRVAGRVSRRRRRRSRASCGASSTCDVEAASRSRRRLAGRTSSAPPPHTTEPVVRRAWLTPGRPRHVGRLQPRPRDRRRHDRRRARCASSRAAPRWRRRPPAATTCSTRSARGVIAEQDIHAELGELLRGRRPGRTSAEQITLYKSVGVAVQDAAAAALVLDAARARHAGRDVEL